MERLVASMRGEGGQHLPSRRKWVMLGKQAKVFKRSPILTCMYGVIDATPPSPK